MSTRNLIQATVFLSIFSVSCAVTAQQTSNIPRITYENVPYGEHPNQIIDFIRADVEGPAPLVIYIHGGGFTSGSHDKINPGKVRRYLDAGIHHASVEYRFMGDARLPAAHEDVVRALQFIRSKAAEWGIDKHRIAAYGGSAGAQLVAYLAWGDDFADPKSDDPVEHESSRLVAVAPSGCQSTMDLDWWVENIPGYTRAYHDDRDHLFDVSQVEFRAIVREISVINQISPDDPPTFLSYNMNPGDPIPEDPRRARGWSIHHVHFGVVMEQKLRESGVEVFLSYPEAELPFGDDVQFLIHHLKN